MKKIAAFLTYVIITIYATALNVVGFTPLGLRTVSLAALMLMAFILWFSRDRQQGISPIDKGFLLYFIINAAGYWILPGRLNRYLTTAPTVFIYGSLAAVTVAPAVFMKRYFTEYFAHKTTPPAVWETDIFRKINRNMTWMWSGIFILSAVIAFVPALLSLEKNLLTSLVIPMGIPLFLMLGVGAPFNKKYPAWYQRRIGMEPIQTIEDGPGKAVSRPAAADKQTKKEEHMSNQLKVVVVNGSPHAGVGNTSIMTQMMKPAFASEGIDLEEIFLAEKRIEYCVGCGVCMEKGKCWRQDDHGEIVEKLLGADGVILASPVYFKHVTAQMKTFIDRSLAYGHKPRTTWKPGMAISVSAGMAETATAEYLAGWLRTFGAFSVGTLTAIAVGPGSFMGMDVIEARATDLAHDLSRAIKEKRRYPVTDSDLFYYLFMGDLVRRENAFMRDDFRHWEESGLYKGFETYIGQTFATPPNDPKMRKEWIRELIAEEVGKTKVKAERTPEKPATPQSAQTCKELLAMMPMGFKKDAAGGLNAVYQFEISGEENFVAHLRISGGTCVFVDGPHEKPDVTVKSPSDVWLAISKGEMNGQAAFMTGKYKVEGDISLLMKLGSMFGS